MMLCTIVPSPPQSRFWNILLTFWNILEHFVYKMFQNVQQNVELLKSSKMQTIAKCTHGIHFIIRHYEFSLQKEQNF